MSLISFHFFGFLSQAPRSFPIAGKVIANHDDSLWGESGVLRGQCSYDNRPMLNKFTDKEKQYWESKNWTLQTREVVYGHGGDRVRPGVWTELNKPRI